MLSALDLGLIYALMALGVYLTFTILDFADLTVDGSFTTGAATTALMITSGQPALLATLAGFGAGLIAGLVTGLLNTAGKIHPLLAGILTQISLYSINLRIMGKANVPMLRNTTLFSGMRENGQLASPHSIAILGVMACTVGGILIWYLSTNSGLALRATGDNEAMARASGINTNRAKLVGLSLSNGLVAAAGSLFAQYQGFADISMGIGLIVAGLASVIIGVAFVPQGRVWVAVVAVIFGSIAYRVILQLALNIPGFDPNDMKLLSALIVILALLIPRWNFMTKIKARHASAEFSTVPFDTPDAEALDSGDTRPPVTRYAKRTRRKAVD
ncbi:MAG: ABC transporter permease [Actinomycetaceae bacterium]|nr:ABC transporter permease [Actinomycetaceae bacterium]MDY6082533.1 ABC transporter permease [Actinomycetaceae bacterium]